MFVEMVLGLRDVPGALVRALEPVSANGGNIVSVLHSRGKGDLVDVNVSFKAKDDETLNRILEAFKKEKVEYREVKVEGHRYNRKKRLSFILVGHVIDQDLQDTIDQINKVGLVRNIEVRMANPDEESAVLMTVNIDEGRMGRLNETLQDVCKRKRIMLIRGVAG
ncbi:MAG: hypothetical protein V1875_10030 [Candidatus Altiarchaeota archaeon]